MLEALILCRFDPIFGPKIILKAPESLEESSIKEIPSLMELRSKGVFIHIFEEIKTANLFFKIPSKNSRGGKEGFLISIITEIDSNLKLILARDLLENFSRDLINLEDAYKAFKIETKEYEGDPIKMKEIENLFFSFYKSLNSTIKTLDIAEHRYQALFKAAREAIFIVDKDLQIILDMNEEAEKIITLKREQLIGNKISDIEILHKAIILLENSDQVENKTIKPIYINYNKLDGQLLYLEVSANEIKLSDQTIIQVLFHDITEIKLAEQELQNHTKNIEILNKIIDVANQANNLKELMDKCLEYIFGFLDLDGCCIYLVDKEREIAEIKAYKGLVKNFIEKKNYIQINKESYKIVFTSGAAAFNNSFLELSDIMLKDTDFKSIAMIPLFSKLEIIGAIVILLRKERQFKLKEIDLFVSVGLQLGTAIERMKNEEYLRQNQLKHIILLNHIPYSFFQISKDGILNDIKIDRKQEKILSKIISNKNPFGKNIEKIFIQDFVNDLKHNINQTFQAKHSTTMKYNYTIENDKGYLEITIAPFGSKDVLIFIQNISEI